MSRLLAIPILAALVAAGCVTPPAEDDLEAAMLATDPALATETVPVALEGTTANAAAVCGPMGCFGTGIPPGQSDSWFDLDVDGLLQGVELTLTWDAQNPHTEDLLLGIAYMKGPDEWDYIYTTGASPLVLSETALGIEGNDIEGVYVNAFKCAFVACTSMAQSFTLEGTLTVETPLVAEAVATAEGA